MKIEDTKKQKTKLPFVVLSVLLLANVLLAVLLAQNMKELKLLREQFAETTDVKEENMEKIDIFLPETVYAVSGMTMEIYNRQVTSLAENITKYNVLWNCEVGENLERKFSVTAEEANLGSYDLTLEIYDNHLELVAQKKCILKIVEEDLQERETAKAITKISEVPAQCMQQVQISVDTQYNGTLEMLKPEGMAQMQDVVCFVLSGIEK